MEQGALTFWHMAVQSNVELFLPYTTASVLSRLTDYAEARAILASARVLLPGRYTRRWARRIRETTGLTREDSTILSLGAFGTDQIGNSLGVHVIGNYDQALINGYTHHMPELARRLQKMTTHLQAPFAAVALPKVATPHEIVTQMLDYPH